MCRCDQTGPRLHTAGTRAPEEKLSSLVGLCVPHSLGPHASHVSLATIIVLELTFPSIIEIFFYIHLRKKWALLDS